MSLDVVCIKWCVIVGLDIRLTKWDVEANYIVRCVLVHVSNCDKKHYPSTILRECFLVTGAYTIMCLMNSTYLLHKSKCRKNKPHAMIVNFSFTEVW